MVIEVITAIVCLLALIAEFWHLRRCQRLAPLAFGYDKLPSKWVKIAPVVRVVSIGFLTWGLSTLLVEKPRAFRPEGEVQPGKEQHLLIVLDVSPSMRLEDAGPTQTQSRKSRARDLMRSLFERIPAEEFLVSVIAVYNGAKPVVVDSKDLDVVDGVLGDLPLYHAFESGQTRLLDGVKEAAVLAKPWNPGSATLLLVTDGDTVPPQGLQPMPVSVGNVIVVGVGDPAQGSFIDGRQSKQDVFTLRQIATRLHGIYHDGNRHHLPSDLVSEITHRGAQNLKEPWTKRDYALFLIGAGGFAYSFLPLFLEYFGRNYYPGVRMNNREIGRKSLRGSQSVSKISSAV